MAAEQRQEAAVPATVRLGAVAIVGADGPMIALLIDERTICISRADAVRWGQVLLREAHKAEGFVLMAAGMEIVGLARTTRDRTLTWAVHHAVDEPRRDHE